MLFSFHALFDKQIKSSQTYRAEVPSPKPPPFRIRKKYKDLATIKTTMIFEDLASAQLNS